MDWLQFLKKIVANPLIYLYVTVPETSPQLALDWNCPPPSLAKTENDFGHREFYLYYYTVVLFIAIEKEIGEETMWKWLKTMIETKTVFTDYTFFEQTFDKVIVDKTLAEKIKSKYFTSDKALENAKAEIDSK